MKPLHIFLGILAAGVLVVIMIAFTFIGSLNKFAKIENKIEAVQVDNQNVLDNTRKAIRDAAAISDKEVESLIEIVTGYAAARGPNPDGGDNNTVSIGMVTEAVPGITRVETLTKLQNILVAGRKDWQAAQTRLIDEKRKADNMLDVFPSSVVLGLFGKESPEIVVVTSSETEENFKSGKDESDWLGGNATPEKGGE